jgi:hypothetical protein
MRLIGMIWPTYCRSIITTYNGKVFLPSDWDKHPQSLKKILLAHEAVHVKQQEKIPNLLYLFLYFFFLPVFWNPFRLRWEKEAFEKTIEITAEIHGYAYVESQQYRDYIAKNFYSPTYGWMWPNKKAVYEWIELTLQGLSQKNPQ